MRDTQKHLRQARDMNREERSKKACTWQAFFLDQNSLRPLFAAMRMRKALSLMKPAASAWL